MAERVSAYQVKIEKLFKDASLKRYPKNQLIYYAGDELSQIYLVKEGFVKAYTILDSGDTRTLFLLGPGDIFPMVFSVTMEWQTYKVKYFYQSLTDVTLQSMGHDTFKELVEFIEDDRHTLIHGG